MSDPTKDMSPWGAAIFNCFKTSDPAKQVENLNALVLSAPDVLMRVPNQAAAKDMPRVTTMMRNAGESV